WQEKFLPLIQTDRGLLFNFGDSGNFGNSNYPITNLPNYQIGRCDIRLLHLLLCLPTIPSTRWFRLTPSRPFPWPPDSTRSLTTARTRSWKLKRFWPSSRAKCPAASPHPTR